MKKLLRERLNNKYYKLPDKKYDKGRSEKNVYLDYISVLNDLIEEVRELRKIDIIFLVNGFNYRQKGCIERCTKLDDGWSTNLEKFHQCYYEMMDFIYYPGFNYAPLSQEEFSIVEMMAVYLINKAKENIKLL